MNKEYGMVIKRWRESKGIERDREGGREGREQEEREREGERERKKENSQFLKMES